jgi:thioredoxin reductase (NADPH)
MLDHDVVIIGGGPAGLTAGLHLSRAGHRALLLEREIFGGNLQNVELVDDHPGFPAGVSGAELASGLAEEARASGVRLREAAVTEVEAFSSTRWVACDDGWGCSAAVVVIATGTRFRTLGIPGEESLAGRGVIHCVPCDGGFFLDRPVAVCGSDDHALGDALSLARLAASVTLLTRSPDLRASQVLQERILAHRKVRVRHGVNLEAVLGSDRVEGVELTDTATGGRRTLDVDGVVIRVGSRPNTDFLEGVVELDPRGRVVANAHAETSSPFILAAGDVRSGAEPRVAAAIADGAAAARRAQELLRQYFR